MIALVTIVSLLALGSTPGDIDTYTMDITLNATSGRLVGTMDLRYTNDSDVILENLMLRLDLNLTRSGTMIINAVTDSEGTPLDWEYKSAKRGSLSDERGLLSVVLTSPLPPGGRQELRITFRLRGAPFLNAYMLVLQDDPYTSLDAWYPKAMSAVGTVWRDEDCRPATYDVSISHDAAIDLASTGKPIEYEKNGDGTATSRFRGAGVRGFTIYGSNSWTPHKKTISGCTIRVHTAKQHEKWAEPFLEAAAEAIDFYRDYYGFFPTDHLELACFAIPGHGSFASHNVCGFFMGGRLEEQYRWLVAHEVAHIYFGTHTGCPRDEIAWVPIGLGLLADHAFLKAKGYPHEFHTRLLWYYREAERRGYDTGLKQEVTTLFMSEDDLWRKGWDMSLSHAKGMAVCGMLRELIGDEKFNELVRGLLVEHGGNLLWADDLLDACREEYEGDLDWFIDDWVGSNRTLDYRIAEVAADDSGIWFLKIRNDGEARFPVPVVVTFTDGVMMRYTADITQREQAFVMPPGGHPKSIIIDPGGITPDLKPENNRWPVGENSTR